MQQVHSPISAEAFTYTSNPVITFTARATDGSVTQNYAGAYFRVDNTTLANRSYSAATGALAKPAAGLPEMVMPSAIGFTVTVV